MGVVEGKKDKRGRIKLNMKMFLGRFEYCEGDPLRGLLSWEQAPGDRTACPEDLSAV